MRSIKCVVLAAMVAGIWAFSVSGTGSSASAAPSIDILTDMQFGNGVSGSQECQPILITEDGANFTTGSDIRLLIPLTYAMTWTTSDTATEMLISGTVVVSAAVSFPASTTDLVCLLDVTTASVAGDRIVVTGLSFRSWSAEESLDSLGMSYNATTTEQTAANQGFCTGGIRLSSANNFSFLPTGSTDLVGTLPTLRITDSSAAATVTSDLDLRITIPNNSTYGTAPIFDVTVTTVTLGGTDAGRVSADVSYSNGSRTCVLTVTTDFAVNSTFTVTGLKFSITTNQAYTADSLQLSRDGTFTTINAVDDKIFCIGPAHITMAAIQTISASAANEAVTTITLTDHKTAPTITASGDIRLIILSTNTSDLTATGRDNLSWDIGATGSPTYGGTASAKVTAGVLTSGDTAGTGGGARLLLIKVATSFSASEALTIDGIKVDNALATATDICIGLIVQGFTDGDVTKAFGKVVSLVSAQSLTAALTTNTSSGSGGPLSRTYGGSSGCFLRGTERPAAQ